MTKKIYISWEDFHQHAKELSQKLKAHGKYNKIIAVSRGGLIPAGIIAYELDIRNNEAINFSSYDNDEKRKTEDIEFEAHVGNVDENTLVVDDLADSGRTFEVLRKYYPKATFVTVYVKEKGASQVDVYAEDMPDEWIVFPWDI